MIKKLLPLTLLLLTSIIYSQSNQQLIKEDALSVYINCWYCDLNFIKEKIPIVNYVNDRKDAEVVILFTTERTGAGGTEYSLFFYGQKKYIGVDDTIKFSAEPAEAQDITRDKTVNAIKLGLLKYVYKTPLADKLIITYKESRVAPTEKPNDNWDFWVFKTSLDGSFSGEERSNYLWLNGSLEANRVTEDLKVRFNVSNSYSENNFKFDTDSEQVKIKSISRNQSYNASSYFSIDDHWSWGFVGNAYTSTYSNIDLSAKISPAIEYDIFPYSESNKKQLRIAYQISPTYNKYATETIYFKTNETLVSQQLSADFTLIEPWGSTSISLEGADYLDDLSKYEIEIYSTISWQLFRGFSFSVYGGYSKIRNQISLPRAGASYEEVLLQRKQLETGYSYWGGFGISFSFGSIYNNIVNPRFGNSGGSTIIITN